MKIPHAIIFTLLANSCLHMSHAAETAAATTPLQTPTAKLQAELPNGKPAAENSNGSLSRNHANCPVLDTNDAWSFRQTQDIPNNSPQVSYTQFQVVFRNKNGSAAMEYLSGEPGHVRKNLGENFLHHVHFTVPEKTCLLDVMSGKSISAKQPFPFPPASGSQWTEDEIIQGTQLTDSYKVIGTEKVKVNAGVFEAMKIEVASRPKVSGENEKPGALQWNERLCTYWYADEVKAMAKSVCEFSDKSRHRLFSLINELDAYELHATTDETP